MVIITISGISEVHEKQLERLRGEFPGAEIRVGRTDIGNPCLSMGIEDYFTPERCERAGVDDKIRTRIIHGCMNRRIFGEKDYRCIPIRTVGELIDFGGERFFKISNVGRKSVDAIRKMFTMDGIESF